MKNRYQNAVEKRIEQKHRKNIKQICDKEAKIDEKSMKNRRRHGRRHRDEKRALEVQISFDISNPRILNKYENIQVL